MNVRKFIAATARDALRKVKETLGPDAIILSNRGIPGGVEIMAVAARDMEMIVPTPERDAPRSKEYTPAASPAASPVPTPLAAREPPQLRAMPPAPGQPSARPSPRPLPPLVARPLPQPPPPVRSDPKPEAEVVPAAVMEEIRTLRRIVEQQLAGFAWGESARSEERSKRDARQAPAQPGFPPGHGHALAAGAGAVRRRRSDSNGADGLLRAPRTLA